MGNRTEKVDVKEDQVCDAPCSLRTSCKNCTQVKKTSAFRNASEAFIDWICSFIRVLACGAPIRTAALTKTPTFHHFRMVFAPNGLHTKVNVVI